MYSLDSLNTSLLLSGVEVGVHYYWDIAGLAIHGQVLLVSWFVIILLLIASFLGTSKLEQVPKGWQNFLRFVLFKHSLVSLDHNPTTFHNHFPPSDCKINVSVPLSTRKGSIETCFMFL